MERILAVGAGPAWRDPPLQIRSWVLLILLRPSVDRSALFISVLFWCQREASLAREKAAASRRTPRGDFMLIEVALNGGRARAEHPNVPCSPSEIAAAAKEAVAAGAGAAHFHVRGADGRESLDADDVARAVSAVRAAIPGIPFGVSTGLWMVRDARERHEKVAAWKAFPDFASVNFNEEGGIALAELLLAKGMGVEAGMGSVLAAEKFLESRLAARCRWILLEPEQQEMDGALAVVAKIEEMLRGAGIALPIILHGVGRTAWELIDVAARRGYDTRIGLEDALTLPDGSAAKGNEELVAEAVKRVGRVVASNPGA
jgi:uncharacterized protein (DUF849 family)